MTRRSLTALAALTASVLLLPAVSSQAQIVTNGGFEAVQIGSPFNSSNPADIPGWTHNGDPGDALLWAIGYADGSGSVATTGSGKQFVTMGGGFFASGAGSWEQTLTGLTPTDTYTLDFKMASEANFSGGQSLTVDFPSGSSTASQLFSAAAPPFNYWSDWESKTMNFVADTSSVTLRFTAATQFDVGLDDVIVTPTGPPPAVPEAGSMALLLGMALTGAGFLMKRRR